MQTGRNEELPLTLCRVFQASQTSVSVEVVEDVVDDVVDEVVLLDVDEVVGEEVLLVVGDDVELVECELVLEVE